MPEANMPEANIRETRMPGTLEQRSAAAAAVRPGERLHPLALRIMHWTNALGIIIMIMSGIKIYGDSPIFSWVSLSTTEETRFFSLIESFWSSNSLSSSALCSRSLVR